MSLISRISNERFYAGQVYEEQVGHKQGPNHDKKNKNIISFEDYLFDYFPRFVVGPHYILLIDLEYLLVIGYDTTEFFCVGSVGGCFYFGT